MPPKGGDDDLALAAPNVYSRTWFWISGALLVTCLWGLVLARPYIQGLVEEAYTSLDELGDSEATTVWRKQRLVAAEEMDALAAVDLLRAQKEEGVEDMDTDFVTGFEPLAPPGFVLAADYGETEEEEEESGGSSMGGQVEGRPQDSQRNISSILPSPSRQGLSGSVRGRQKGQQQQKPWQQGGIGSPAAGAAASRHSGFTLRRRRFQPPVPPPQPPAPPQPVPIQVPEIEPITAPAIVEAQGPSIHADVPQLGGFDLSFVDSNGQHLGYQSNEGPVKVWESPRWPLRKDKKWQAPPRECPGSPVKRSMKDGAPPPKLRAYIEKAIRMMSEGKYEEDFGNGTTKIVENRCMYLTKDCSDPNLPYGGNSAKKMLKMSDSKYEAWRNSKLVDLKPRMLGSCALVANSENLIKGKRGAEIDAHDTIFRHNTPVKGFEKAVGARKSSVIWVKAKYLKQLKSSGISAEFMYDLLLGIDRLPKSFEHKGKPLMITNKNGGYNAMVRERIKWYKMVGAKAKNHPSGGFARPLSLLASGLCTRVDIYGFSSRPSGKYFQRSFKVLPTHMMKFEHWVYRYLMQIGKMCVYGD